MDIPIAFKLTHTRAPDVYRVRIDDSLTQTVGKSSDRNSPTIIVVRKAEFLPSNSSGIIEPSDVIAVHEGDWSRTVIVVDQATKGDDSSKGNPEFFAGGDTKFLEHVRDRAPSLAGLAAVTIKAIRESGVDGELVEGSGGRWVNRPLNTFTLKAQPRAENLQFTLYGNPDSFAEAGFLLRDQNSYSRGWVREKGDAIRLAALAQESHARRLR